MSFPRTTIRHLSYFVALAEAGSFTRAAERMGVSQPSLSQQIRALETIVGAALFERGGPAILTPLAATCSSGHGASCSTSSTSRISGRLRPIP